MSARYTDFFAAKSNKESKWESILRHAEDTAGVMDRLCDMETGFVSPAFAVATGLEPAVLKKTCIFVATVHDIAKITPEFQWKIQRTIHGLETDWRHTDSAYGQVHIGTGLNMRLYRVRYCMKYTG